VLLSSKLKSAAKMTRGFGHHRQREEQIRKKEKKEKRKIKEGNEFNEDIPKKVSDIGENDR